MEYSRDPGLVKTRFFILSDTHGVDLEKKKKYRDPADVAVRCGDLTEEPKLEEFRTSLRLLNDVQAPLKLVIAENHDFTLDEPIFRVKVAKSQQPIDLVKKEFGDYGEARQLFEDAKSAGIIFLDEGTHQFTLANGAKLSIYASPFTPSLGEGEWGFQYPRSEGHGFQIKQGVDLVMTHGPPKGILDYTVDKQRAGCPDLFSAIARACPRLHCFGHIHEGWGAKMVTWREQLTEKPSHFTDIDNDKSTVIETLRSRHHGKFDTEEMKEEKSKRVRDLWQQNCYATSHCGDDAVPLEYESQTLFVNAAIQSSQEDLLQLPWLVDIELPKAI